MTRLLLLPALLLATAQTAVPTPPLAPNPAPTQAPAADTVDVTITTTAGPIVVALDRGHAPISTANFLRYVDGKRFDGIAFYRSMKLPWNAGLIQAGQRDGKKIFPPIRTSRPPPPACRMSRAPSPWPGANPVRRRANGRSWSAT